MAIQSGHAVTIELQYLLREGITQAKRLGHPVLVSFTEPTWSRDEVSLFEQAAHLVQDRFFWSQPDKGFTLVGLGIAAALEAVEEARFRQIGSDWRQLLRGAILEGPHRLPGAGPLLMGGFAFDPQRPKTPLWEGYPDAHMALPKILYTARSGEAWLTVNVIVSPDTDADAQTAEITALLDGLAGSSRTKAERGSTLRQESLHQYDLRPAQAWQADVARTVQDIAEGKLAKAVLARSVRLESRSPFQIGRALRGLAERFSHCYIFAMARGERCFLGATPEQLAELHNGILHTMSLAGSIRRGTTEEDDDYLGLQLLTSAKNREEHGLVVDAMREGLATLCDDLRVQPSPVLLKLGNVQHLCTPIQGHLSGEYTLLDVAERLFPTPAVGGRPRDVALALIREREDMDRGWYAGPVGWLDQHGEGEFAIALRSALVNGAEATLFAGCGIVADSDPAHEYTESCLKLRAMLSVLANG